MVFSSKSAPARIQSTKDRAKTLSEKRIQLEDLQFWQDLVALVVRQEPMGGHPYIVGGLKGSPGETFVRKLLKKGLAQEVSPDALENHEDAVSISKLVVFTPKFWAWREQMVS